MSPYSSVYFVVCLQFALSGLIGKARHADIQKILINEFFYGNRLHWPFEWSNFYRWLFYATYLFAYT